MVRGMRSVACFLKEFGPPRFSSGVRCRQGGITEQPTAFSDRIRFVHLYAIMASHVRQRFAAPIVPFGLVGKEVNRPDTAMPPGLGEGDLLLLQKLDQERSRHVQQIGRLLRGQFRIDGNQPKPTPAGDQAQHVQKRLGDGSVMVMLSSLPFS